MGRIPLTVLSVRFVMFCDVPVPSYRGLVGYLEFDESSRLSPVFVSAALETAVLLPKFIRACPNALLQRKRFQVTPPVLMDGSNLYLLAHSAVVQRKLGGMCPYNRIPFWTDPT